MVKKFQNRVESITIKYRKNGDIDAIGCRVGSEFRFYNKIGIHSINRIMRLVNSGKYHIYSSTDESRMMIDVQDMKKFDKLARQYYNIK